VWQAGKSKKPNIWGTATYPNLKKQSVQKIVSAMSPVKELLDSLSGQKGVKRRTMR
jgi:hypothetical protein